MASASSDQAAPIADVLQATSAAPSPTASPTSEYSKAEKAERHEYSVGITAALFKKHFASKIENFKVNKFAGGGERNLVVYAQSRCESIANDSQVSPPQ